VVLVENRGLSERRAVMVCLVISGCRLCGLAEKKSSGNEISGFCFSHSFRSWVLQFLVGRKIDSIKIF
jgi:hypothetical protein